MFFAKNLRYLRKEAGHSQEFLADYLGYKNYTTIQKWESGNSEPPLNIVAKLSSLYDVSMDDLTNHLTKEKPALMTGFFINNLFTYYCSICIDYSIKIDYNRDIEENK